MIGKAKAISHGINDIRYITGESTNKKRPDKICRIMDNMLPSHLDAMGIWNSMQFTLSSYKNVKNSLIRIELSPSAEQTKLFTLADWKKLWREFAIEFDKQNIQDKNGKVISNQTHLLNSKHTVWLHTESIGEVPHLHAAVCRVDEDGNINNDHHIHLRAQRAAEKVAISRGWITASQKRIVSIAEVSRDCLDVIRKMSSFSWTDYKVGLICKGYSVHEHRDSKNNLHGYTLRKGNAKYKASELGVGRNLMVSKLYHTWIKEHHHNSKEVILRESRPIDKVRLDYTTYKQGTVPYSVTINGQEQKFYIPEKVYDLLDDEFDYRFISNAQELMNMAVSLFVGLITTQDVCISCSGGGSQSESPEKKKDDNDLERARKCAIIACNLLGKKQKKTLRR